MWIEEIIQKIQPINIEKQMRAMAHWDHLAKPLRSLGNLEEVIARIAATQTSEELAIDHRTLLVFCADNGIICHGVSQSDETVTTAVAAALGKNCSTVNFLAQGLQLNVRAIDVGMKEQTPFHVECCKIANGTKDCTEGSAMSRDECLQAMEIGARLALEEKNKGTQILLLGEMGIGNTTTSCCVGSVLLNSRPENMVGRGAGLSDEGLKRKLQAIECAIDRNRPNPEDPIEILQKVGGFDLAALTGACLGAAYACLPVLLDGVITDVAALCACRIESKVKDYLIASHCSKEPMAQMLLTEMGLEPLITAGLHLGEGSGAVLSLPLLDQALKVYHSSHTFEHLGIEAYKPLS